MADKKPKPPILPYETEAIGILNPNGQIWSRNTFDTEAAAKAYVANFWKTIKTDVDLRKYSYVPVKVVVTPA